MTDSIPDAQLRFTVWRDAVLRDAAAERDHAGDVRGIRLAGDVAEDDLADIGRPDAGPRQHGFHGDAPELVGGDVRQCAERLGERSPHPGQDGQR